MTNLKTELGNNMRREMIYVQVQVSLEYIQGARNKAVTGAKEMVSAAVSGIYAKCESYKVKSDGKIRERKKTNESKNQTC